MYYYKIIKNNEIIDVNNVFLCISKKYPDMLIPCELRNVQYLQSSDGEQLYITNWTAPVSHPLYSPELIEAVLINEEEYQSLKDTLQNQTIIVEENEVQPSNQQEEFAENIDEPQVMNITEMKRKILELEQLVQKLLNK